MAAHLEGALNISFDGVYHSPVGADDEQRPWYGSPAILNQWVHHLLSWADLWASYPSRNWKCYQRSTLTYHQAPRGALFLSLKLECQGILCSVVHWQFGMIVTQSWAIVFFCSVTQFSSKYNGKQEFLTVNHISTYYVWGSLNPWNFHHFCKQKAIQTETFSFSNTTKLQTSAISSWSVNAVMTTKICQHRPLFYDDMSINMVNNIRVNMHVKGAANCGHNAWSQIISHFHCNKTGINIRLRCAISRLTFPTSQE